MHFSNDTCFEIRVSSSVCLYSYILILTARENLNNREGQIDSTPVDKNILSWRSCYPKSPLERVFKKDPLCENRGPKVYVVCHSLSFKFSSFRIHEKKFCLINHDIRWLNRSTNRDGMRANGL